VAEAGTAAPASADERTNAAKDVLSETVMSLLLSVSASSLQADAVIISMGLSSPMLLF
jgi:hypothetical protein